MRGASWPMREKRDEYGDLPRAGSHGAKCDEVYMMLHVWCIAERVIKHSLTSTPIHPILYVGILHPGGQDRYPHLAVWRDCYVTKPM